MHTTMMRAALPLTIVSLAVFLVHGVFETGLTYCPPNDAGITPTQIDSGNVTFVPFYEASYSLVYNDTVVVDNVTEPLQLERGSSFRLAVVSDGEPFLAALIRASGVSGAFDADVNSQRATACAGEQIYGVTNFNADPKTVLSGVLTVTGGDFLVLDVTVVAFDDDVTSTIVYSYKQYILRVVDRVVAPSPPTTSAPVPTAVLMPVTRPTSIVAPTPTVRISFKALGPVDASREETFAPFPSVPSTPAADSGAQTKPTLAPFPTVPLSVVVTAPTPWGPTAPVPISRISGSYV